MSKNKEDYDIDLTKPDGDIAIAQAIPQPNNSNEPPIPAGHARFYCSKCHTVRKEIVLHPIYQCAATATHAVLRSVSVQMTLQQQCTQGWS